METENSNIPELVKEDDEEVNFGLVEPAKNHKPWTPKFLTILSPLNNSRASRSASGINAYDEDDDLYTVGELVVETGDPKEAIYYALEKAGIKATPKSRFSVDDILDLMIKSGRPEGWVPSSEFMRISGACKSLVAEMREKDERFRPIQIGTVQYFDPGWDALVISYRIKRADERAAARLAARKAYHPTSSGPLLRVKYPAAKREGFIPPQPSWLTQARAEGLMTSTQIAELIGVSKATVCNWADAGILAPARIIKTGRAGVRLFKQLDKEEIDDLYRRLKEVKAEHARAGAFKTAAKVKELHLHTGGDGMKAAIAASVAARKKFMEDCRKNGSFVISDLSEYLGYSFGYVQKLVKTNKIKHSHVGRNVVVTKEDADAWKDQHEGTPATKGGPQS